MKIIILPILGIIAGSLALYDHSELIKDFLAAKYLYTGVIFGCDDKQTVVKLMKSLNGTRVQYYHLDYIQNITNLTEIMYRKTHHLGVIIDGACVSANFLIQKCGWNKMINTAFQWLLITKAPNFAWHFTNVSIHLDSNFAVAVPQSSNNYTIYDVYNPSSEHNGELKITRLGYRNESGYVAKIKGNKYWARKNLTGVKFKSAIMIPIKFNLTVEEYLANDSHSEINSMHRFQATTIRHCQDMYNFSLSIRKTPSWGYIVPGTDKKFDGLVGYLQRKEVDFGCTPLIFKYDRLPVVDYSFGNWILKSVFIYVPPKGKQSSFKIFTMPLGQDVWISSLLISILIGILLKIILVAEWHVNTKAREDCDYRWSYVVMTVFGAFCLQGAAYSPQLYSGRTLTLFYFMFYIMLYQFYAGFLVSYLLMDPPRMINNLADLLHSSLDAGIENILIDKDYFVQTKDPNAIQIYNTKVRRGNRSGYYEVEEGLEKVKHGGFAFHVETCTAYPHIKATFPPKTICKLEEVQMYNTQPMHTNAQKHSPFREMLNFCMLRLVEHGLMYRLRDKWDAHRPGCIEADNTLEITVGIGEFACALVVLLVAMITSSIFFCFEVLVDKRNSARGGTKIDAFTKAKLERMQQRKQTQKLKKKNRKQMLKNKMQMQF